MKKLNVLLAIFLGWNAQTFAAEVATLGSLLDDPVVTLSTNMRTILRTSSLDKATCSAEQKDALADQAMQVFTSNIPRLMQFVPFERQNNFTTQVTDLMQESANAYPAQMSVTFIMNGIQALSQLDEGAFGQRITETKSAIQTALLTIQPKRDLNFVAHTLCAKWGFVGFSL
jgi:hypothetical protein